MDQTDLLNFNRTLYSTKLLAMPEHLITSRKFANKCKYGLVIRDKLLSSGTHVGSVERSWRVTNSLLPQEQNNTHAINLIQKV
jgi:hypothetical protein